MSRPDPFLNMLKDIGYLPLRLPRADVAPLQLLNLEGKNLSLLGDLDDAMDTGSVPLPPIKADITTAGQIQGTRSETVKLSLGLDILGNLLGALTGSKLDVSAGFNKAATLTFEVGDVTVSCVSIIVLDKYLNTARIDSAAKQIQELMQEGQCAVTTAVARSKKYVVCAQDENGVDIKVDVPVIKGIASGNVGVSTTGKDNIKVVFEGTSPVTFGVQAAQLRFDENGTITSLKQLAAGSGAVLGMRAPTPARAQPKPNLVTFGGGGFVDITSMAPKKPAKPQKPVPKKSAPQKTTKSAKPTRPAKSKKSAPAKSKSKPKPKKTARRGRGK